MMAEPSLELLQAMVQRVLDKLSEHGKWQADTSKRLLAIERSIAAVRRDAVLDAEHITDVRASLDALTERVAQIERRLDIAS
jgi:polyhydroxyalkanoate synthesis regulator phasin